MVSNEANSALLKLIQKGPTFDFPEAMGGRQAATAADVQYQTWASVYILPLLSQALVPAGDTITGTIGDNSSGVVGKDISQ